MDNTIEISEKQDFDTFLRKSLSHWDYEHLDELLQESPHKTTKIKNDPAIGEMKHLAILMTLIKKWAPNTRAHDIIDQFSFGHSTTTDEVRAMLLESNI